VALDLSSKPVQVSSQSTRVRFRSEFFEMRPNRLRFEWGSLQTAAAVDTRGVGFVRKGESPVQLQKVRVEGAVPTE